MKYLEIKITKATLFLTERELLDALPRDLFVEGLRRGKAILRTRKQKGRKRQLQVTKAKTNKDA